MVIGRLSGSSFRKVRVVCFITWLGLVVPVSATEKPPVAFFERHCLDCHDADTAKGELNLERLLDSEITEHAAECVRCHMLLKQVQGER